MPLHLNLYHEIQKQQLQRRRDPLKLGIYAVGVLIALLIGYYFYRMQQVYDVTRQSGQLQTQWQSLEPKSKDAAALEIVLTAQSKLKETVVSKIDYRFFWAPMLQKIQIAVPRNVQITTFRGSFEPGGRTGAISLNGVAAGAQPRKVAEDLRTALLAKCLQSYTSVTSNFSSLEDSEATVLLDGKTMATALFSLQFQFTVPLPGATPSPTPVPIK